MAVGVDPNGGTDPSVGDAVWTQAQAADAWRPTTVRATANGSRITVFVMVGTSTLGAGVADDGGRDAANSDDLVGYVDEVALLAVPCPLPDIRRPKLPPEDARRCIDWKREKAPQRLGEQTERGGVRFRAGAGALQLIQFGANVGLLMPARGLFVEFPKPAGEVIGTFVVHGSGEIRVAALDGTGRVVANTTSTDDEGPNRTIRIAAKGAEQIVIVTRSGAEALLLKLCWAPATDRRAIADRPTNNVADLHAIQPVQTKSDKELN